jgi:hypothetical protein
MKALSGISLNDVPLDVVRYRPVISRGTSAFDEYGDAEDFDQFSLRSLTQDFMHAEPAMRYQIARNYFERSLFDAKVLIDVARVQD